jgi:hypothetical protein
MQARRHRDNTSQHYHHQHHHHHRRYFTWRHGCEVQGREPSAGILGKQREILLEWQAHDFDDPISLFAFIDFLLNCQFLRLHLS